MKEFISMPDNKHESLLNERIRHLRESLGLSRTEFKELTGFSDSNLRAIELGNIRITNPMMTKLINAFAKVGIFINKTFLIEQDTIGIALLAPNRNFSYELIEQVKQFHEILIHPTISMVICDNAMDPIFKSGYILSGNIISDKKDYRSYKKQYCIIKLGYESQPICRILDFPETYYKTVALRAFNQMIDTIVLKTHEIEYIAPVTSILIPKKESN